jgi:hypothetical protein
MAKTRNQSLLDNVRSTLTGNRGSRSGGRNSRRGGGLASQASGFIGGLLDGENGKSNRNRGRRRR